jgi:hypothetical protein
MINANKDHVAERPMENWQAINMVRRNDQV